MNKLYSDLLRARVQGALAEAAALRAVDHRGLKGELRELLVARLLSPLLPPTFGITSGVIITAKGEQSSQTDVIVYDRRLIPPFLISETGLVPIEAVLFAIEVKSTLDVTELRKAHEAASKLLTFDLLPGEPLRLGDNYTFRSPIPALFAFGSDLKQESSEIERYQREFAGDPSILKLCVVGKGMWRRVASQWSQWPCTSPNDEVIGFLASVLNTLPSLSASRGSPAMGGYVAD